MMSTRSIKVQGSRLGFGLPVRPLGSRLTSCVGLFGDLKLTVGVRAPAVLAATTNT